MATEVILPKVDMVMDTGTFVEWLKVEGESVEKGKPLFVIMTDKAAIEVESPASGILAGLRASPGDVIPVSTTIAYILQDGEVLPAMRHSEPAEPLAPPVAQTSQETLASKVVEQVAGPSSIPSKVRATPIARRMAVELGVDLASLRGRGPNGRIHRADVAKAAEVRAVPTIPTDVPARGTLAPEFTLSLPDARRRDVIPLAGPRKIIAQRMAYSKSVAPHITLSMNVDMSEAVRLRSRLLDVVERNTGQRLSFTAILLRAVAAVLPRHPFLNASLVGEEIILWEDVHIGIATSLENYLIVPVIRQAQDKNLEQIVVTLADLLTRARAKRLSPAEMSGSTFSVSNLGMFGIESFTAIINPPESAILSVGKIKDSCLSLDGEIVQRPLMNLTINADHRVIDGAVAANYLMDLKNVLENPYLLV